jgi:hypothetical protein
VNTVKTVSYPDGSKTVTTIETFITSEIDDPDTYQTVARWFADNQDRIEREWVKILEDIAVRQ